MNSTAENSKEQLQKQLILDDFFFNAADYVHKKRALFISLGIGLLVTLLAGFGISWYLKYSDNNRDIGLYKIERVLRNENLSDAEKLTRGGPLLDNFIDQNSGTSQERIALFHRANLYFSNNKLAKSEGDLRSLLAKSAKDSGFYVLTSIYLANVLRDQNKIKQSVQVLEEAQSEIMTDVILMELAEIYASQKKNTLAKQNLDALIKDYPSSLYYSRAKGMLEQLSL